MAKADAPRHPGLYQAILEQPADDALRSIYADWLEDHGDPERAEFIRAQIELSRLPADSPRHPELAAQQERLLKANRKRWTAGLPPWAREHARFRRGFVAEVSGTIADWVADGARLFELAPLDGLNISGREQGGQLRQLVEQPFLARFTRLDLSDGDFHRQDIEALVASPHLGQVRWLDLGGNEFDADGVELLAGCPDLAGLTGLALDWTLIEPAGARAIASSPYLGRLEQLRLWASAVRDSGAEALASSPNLAHLTHLRLEMSGMIGDRGAIALANSPHLANLRVLDLADNDIRTRGARALAASGHLTNLAELRLQPNPIGPVGLRLLRGRFGGRVLT